MNGQQFLEEIKMVDPELSEEINREIARQGKLTSSLIRVYRDHKDFISRSFNWCLTDRGFESWYRIALNFSIEKYEQGKE